MSKTMKATLITLVLVVIATLSFGAGYGLAAKTRPTLGQGLDLAVEAWHLILNNHVERDTLDTDNLSRGAIRGMVAALDDPHTSYLSAEASQLGRSSLEGKIEGIGAHVTVKDKQLTIIAPVAGSPAAEAGIKAGDVILEINGMSASGMSLAEAVLTIRGPKGTSVKLLILHQGETKPEEIEIFRAEIKISSVNFEMRGDIAYLNITNFSERTGEELSPVLQSISQQGAKGIVLDLRSNPGGILEAVIDVASHFLKEGVVVKVRDSQGRITTRHVKSKVIVTDLPLVVLVDSFSASGSEVLAGALQDHGRATIAGTITYGKGSVNTMHRLKDGSGLVITVARWLTPNDHLIEGKGLSPDYELEELSSEDALQWAIEKLKSQH